MLNMSQDRQVTEEMPGNARRTLTERELARMLLDIGTSDLVLKGKLPGRLTQEEVDGLVKISNAPLTDTDFNEMDRSSDTARSSLAKGQVYIILILLHEANWSPKEIAEAFNISPATVTDIGRGNTWSGTFQRYCRAIAEQLGITREMVCRLLCGESWSDVL